MTNPQRCIVWAAVSTTGQADDDRASLPAQEADALAYAESQGWRVVDILRVPGHSRAYIDIHECAADMRAAGIDAFDRLIQHWKARDFDVLICRDGSRFARTQALHSYVVERTIEIGARIYSLAEGWVDKQNYRMFTSMGGYAAASEIDRMRSRLEIGKDGRVLKKGLASNGRVPRSHLAIRDPRTGKITHVELNPDTAQEWQDLAVLLLEGIPYSMLGNEMFTRYGYGYRGLAHGHHHYWELLHKPTFWGHTAHHYSHRPEPWVYLEDELPPPPAIVNRNTHPPVYTGELGEQVKAELLRRYQSIHGRARANHTFALSGMVNCAVCGYRMHYTGRSNGAPTLACQSRYQLANESPCTGRNSVREALLIAQLTPVLEHVHRTGILTFSDTAANEERIEQELVRVLAEVERIEAQIGTLIDKQAVAPGGVSHLYDAKIEALSKQLEHLNERRISLNSRINSVNHRQQQQAIRVLQSHTIDEFWSLDSVTVNQTLHRLFGKLRFFVNSGRLVGIGEPERKRGKRRDR